MANSFEHISIAAVKVLAKQAGDIHIRACALVDEHPELIDAARDRAQRLGMYERRRRAAHNSRQK